jgi:hypothetical protein
VVTDCFIVPIDFRGAGQQHRSRAARALLSFDLPHVIFRALNFCRSPGSRSGSLLPNLFDSCSGSPHRCRFSPCSELLCLLTLSTVFIYISVRSKSSLQTKFEVPAFLLDFFMCICSCVRVVFWLSICSCV